MQACLTVGSGRELSPIHGRGGSGREMLKLFLLIWGDRERVQWVQVREIQKVDTGGGCLIIK